MVAETEMVTAIISPQLHATGSGAGGRARMSGSPVAPRQPTVAHGPDSLALGRGLVGTARGRPTERAGVVPLARAGSPTVYLIA
jgi:hypothetical protein